MPRISIITPSYNQAAFLEETIRSVLDQDYPNLQYGIVDGGSTDGSIDIIERYRDRCDFVIIERDGGQSEAINKGLSRADGQVIGWLNSDDTLLPGALRLVAERFAADPALSWLIGTATRIDARGRPLGELTPTGDFTLAGALIRDTPILVPQPATFWRRALTDAVGLLDESLHHCMDFDLWCRFMAAEHQPLLLSHALATYREHESSKTCSQADRFIVALIGIEKRYRHLLPLRDQMRLLRRIGFQERALAVRLAKVRPWRQVLRRPWWLLSQQVRAALLGTVVGPPSQA
ncbi:MAG: glycosyltransferase family 2 protein [Phycisphaeraceae bacterium]